MTLSKVFCKSFSTKVNIALKTFKTSQGIHIFETKVSPTISEIVSKNGFLPSLKLKIDYKINYVHNFYLEKPRQASIIKKADILINKKIIEPENFIKTNLETPPKNLTDQILELPFYIKKDIIEPTNEIISKKALNIIHIRKKKMRKHKLRKLRKKMKFVFQKIRHRRKVAKETIFQNELQQILNEGEKFNAEEQVNTVLNTLHTVKPINRVRGRLAPKWVIKEYLKDQEEKNKFKERIEFCLKEKM